MSGKKQVTTGVYTTQNRVRLIHSGREYFSELNRLIDIAQVSVNIQVYIFNEDKTGTNVANALIRAAERGVKVYLLVDGYASPEMSGELLQKFKASHVYFSRFEPLFKSRKFYFGRRLHHKVAAIDGYYALVGGINIADRYNDVDGMPAWLDYAVSIEGEAAHEISKLCMEVWNGSAVPSISQIGQIDKAKYESILPEERCSVRVRTNDWVKRKNLVWKSYTELFNQANEQIIIVCSYFLPGWTFRNKMMKAVKRGVSVKVVVAGPSDVPLAKYAERYLYKWMLKNRIEVYEYQKNVLHAKLAICDDRWMTIGSYNVNNISAYASMELNIDIRNKPFVKNTENEILDIIANDCVRIDAKNYKLATNVFKYILQKAAYEFINIVLFLFTFYFKKE
jgi:cardiolipin synthase